MFKSAPSAFDYLDYRQFFADRFAHWKSQSSAASLEALGRKVKLSKVAVKYVLDGKRHLSRDSLARYCDAFELDPKSRKYLEHMLFFNKARTASERDESFSQMLKLKGSSIKEALLKDSELGFFQEWYYPIIAEMSYLDEFEKDAFWIQSRLKFQVPIRDIRKALKYLQQHGYLRNQDRSDTKIKADEAVQDEVIGRYLTQQIEKSRDALSKQPKDQRDAFNITISVNEQKLAVAKDMILRFRHELHDVLANSDNCDRVIQINMQLFTAADNGQGAPK